MIEFTAKHYFIVSVVALGFAGCAPADDPAPASAVHTQINPSLEPGTDNEFFVAETSTRLVLRPDVVATATPEEGPSTYHLGRGPGGPGGPSFGISCTCSGGCAGVCVAEVSGAVATCSGSCNESVVPGDMCVSPGCSWHQSFAGPPGGVFIALAH